MTENTCSNCGADWSRHLTRGRCRACYVYWWRCGVDRPAYLWARVKLCMICSYAAQPTAGRRCFACAHYRRYHHGVERPAHLWGRRVVAA